MKFFVPFTVQRTNLLDLSTLLKDPQLLVAIFNQDYKATISQDWVGVQEKDGTKVLSCRKLGLDKITIEPVVNSTSEGSIITIPGSNFLREDGYPEAYIRFRIKISKTELAVIARDYSPSDQWLSSAFERTEIVDFRLNETRNLPDQVRDEMRNGSRFVIKEVNFFLVRTVHGHLEVSSGTGQHQRTRTLESQLWLPYLRQGYPDTSRTFEALIYYWRARQDANAHGQINDFYALAKFRHRHSSRLTVLVAVLIVLLLGLLDHVIYYAALSRFVGGEHSAIPPDLSPLWHLVSNL